MWGAIIGGAAQVAGSLIGGGKRRREQKKAQLQNQADEAAVRDFQFTNSFKGLENTAEDLTVNNQAANFQAAQTDQALAGALDASTQGNAAGGGNAIALANAALGAKQGISNDLAAQESQNQQLRQQEASNLQAAEATGEQDLQSQRYTQAGTNLELSGSRLQAANDARQQATNQLVGGIGQIAGGVGAAAEKAGGLGKLFGK